MNASQTRRYNTHGGINLTMLPANARKDSAYIGGTNVDNERQQSEYNAGQKYKDDCKCM